MSYGLLKAAIKNNPFVSIPLLIVGKSQRVRRKASRCLVCDKRLSIAWQEWLEKFASEYFPQVPGFEPDTFIVQLPRIMADYCPISTVYVTVDREFNGLLIWKGKLKVVIFLSRYYTRRVWGWLKVVSLGIWLGK